MKYYREDITPYEARMLLDNDLNRAEHSQLIQIIQDMRINGFVGLDKNNDLVITERGRKAINKALKTEK